MTNPSVAVQQCVTTNKKIRRKLGKSEKSECLRGLKDERADVNDRGHHRVSTSDIFKPAVTISNQWKI